MLQVLILAIVPERPFGCGSNSFVASCSHASYPPLAATYRQSNMYMDLQSRGGKGMGTPCDNCCQTGHASGSPKSLARGTKCNFCQRPNHCEVVCQTKKRSQQVMGSDEFSQMKHIMSLKATQSALPFLQTIYFISHAGKLKVFHAEVDTGSFCTIIDSQYLSSHLPDMPVKALKGLPCTYDHSPICTLQGRVDVCICSADRAISTTIYVATSPCQPLIGCDLIDGLGLIIQGRGVSKQEGPSSVTSPELPSQPSLILKV